MHISFILLSAPLRKGLRYVLDPEAFCRLQTKVLSGYADEIFDFISPTPQNGSHFGKKREKGLFYRGNKFLCAALLGLLRTQEPVKRFDQGFTQTDDKAALRCLRRSWR